MKTAVIYARVSSVGDRQSTTRQVDDLKRYAQVNGYEVINTYEEHISGATKNEDRAVLCRCLDFCITNKIDTLLISELSRLGRNVDEVLANVKYCKDNNLNIYFQKENLSLFNADGSKNPFLTIFISVLGTCAELERDNIKFRLQSGLKRYREQNGVMGRKVGSVKSKQKKQEEYAKVIKLLKGGQSVRNTAKLCEVGISTVQRIKKEFAI
ncbi:MAG: recombinase family protein [Alistipes sp.]|nr:recombinase family protein [Alistipes sp.]